MPLRRHCCATATTATSESGAPPRCLFITPQVQKPVAAGLQGDVSVTLNMRPVPAPRHLGTFHHRAPRRRPRCPLTTARATRLAFRLVTPNAGRVVSPTTPRCVLGRSSYSPLTQRPRSAVPRLTRLTPARAPRLTPVTPRSPPEPASLPTTLTITPSLSTSRTPSSWPRTPRSHTHTPPVVTRVQKPQ